LQLCNWNASPAAGAIVAVINNTPAEPYYFRTDRLFLRKLVF
jgi:hypothetical protein